jgi:hypothetical protein
MLAIALEVSVMTDLTDFGGGYEIDEANPEDKVNQKLSQWLARQQQVRVLWDRKRSYGHGTFSVSGTSGSKPDLVIEGPGSTYAVEVKRGGKSGQLYKGVEQTIQYWCHLESGEAEYTSQGELLDIEAVLLATKYSPSGHLFHNNHRKDPRRSGRGDGSQQAAARSLIPSVEHTASETLVRLQNSAAKILGEQQGLSGKTGVGALLSSVLDGDGESVQASKPAAFHHAYGRGNLSTSWDYIPFFARGDAR